MSGYPETVEITKTVPVNDHETLVAWLNLELQSWHEQPDFSGSDHCRVR